MRKKSDKITSDETFVVGHGPATRHLRWWRYEGGWDVNLSVARKSARPADVFVDFRDLDELHDFLQAGLMMLDDARAAKRRSRSNDRIGDSLESSPDSGEQKIGDKA